MPSIIKGRSSGVKKDLYRVFVTGGGAFTGT